MPKYDYGKLYTFFAKVVSEKTKLILADLNGDGLKPQMPFVSFDVISPYIRLNWQEDDSAQEFEAVISLTAIDDDKQSALNTALSLRSCFDAVGVQDELRSANIILVERMDMQIRSVPDVNHTTKMVGFDLRLRLQGEQEATADPIKDIQFKEE